MSDTYSDYYDEDGYFDYEDDYEYYEEDEYEPGELEAADDDDALAHIDPNVDINDF